jgi:hypothetical protein
MEQVEVERVVILSKREKRLARLAESSRQANEIARKRNALTKKNRENARARQR